MLDADVQLSDQAIEWPIRAISTIFKAKGHMALVAIEIRL
jgi:hypothetical protein